MRYQKKLVKTEKYNFHFSLRLCAFAAILFTSCTPQETKSKQDSIFQTSYIQPQNIIKKGDGHYFIDFGKDAFGALTLNFKAAQSDSLIIHLGEKLSTTNTIDRNPGYTIRYAKVTFKDTLLDDYLQVRPAPDGRNDQYPAVALPDSFGRIMPFRYCEIENLNVPIESVDISQKVFNYRFNDDASYFASSDTILNQVWELCKYTVKATSFCGYYVDGDRERIPYEADALINQLSHYAVDSEYSLAKRTNKYFIDHPTWPTEWILQTVMLFYYDYLYTGDTTSISRYYDILKCKTLMEIAEDNGLINVKSPTLTPEVIQSVGFDAKYTDRPIEDIIDWPPSERDDYDMNADVKTVINSFYYINMKFMAEIAKALNKNEDANIFRSKAIAVKDTINSKFLNPETGIYVDGEGTKHSSLHANMFPLAFGIVPDKNRNRIVSFIKSKGMACSVYGAQYLLEALYQAGESDYALSLMNATEGNRNWWNMIREGSTMTMEAWCTECKWNTDWNHAWATAPANIVSRYLWGITPALPGFEEVIVKPQMGNLTSSSIKVPTIKGAIIADYKKDKNTCYYNISLPKHMEGRFIPENTGNIKIIFNGKLMPIKTSELRLKEDINRIEIINKL